MALDRNKVARNAEKLVARGKLNAAIDEYRKLLAESANDTTTLNRVGDLYARLNRLDKATALFKKTADHFINEGFFVKAIAIYKKIIRLDPAQIEVYERLADLYSRQGLLNEERAYYETVAGKLATRRTDEGELQEAWQLSDAQLVAVYEAAERNNDKVMKLYGFRTR